LTADLKRYSDFVDEVTSPVSKDTELFINRLRALEKLGINSTQLLTASEGLGGETGEFSEIVKKLNWHEKPFTEELHQHLEKELGDIIFYWIMACQALKLDPDKVVKKNVGKLEARYPGGKFSVDSAENRAEGDV